MFSRIIEIGELEVCSDIELGKHGSNELDSKREPHCLSSAELAIEGFVKSSRSLSLTAKTAGETLLSDFNNGEKSPTISDIVNIFKGVQSDDEHVKIHE